MSDKAVAKAAPPIRVYHSPRREPCAFKLPWRATYTQEAAERICDEVAVGRTLERIAIEEAWAPSARQMRYWMMDHPEFESAYRLAVHMRAEKLAQDVLDVADDLLIDPEDRRIMIAARQWLAGKMNPRDWGERKIVDANVTAQISTVSKVDVSHLTLDEIHAAERAFTKMIEGSVAEDDE